jgi:hypothetical protein
VLSKQALGNATLFLENGTGVHEPPRRVYLTQDVNTSCFWVTVSRFKPGPGEATSYFWTDAAGVKHEFPMPPYYISDMAEARRNMRHYARTARPEFTRALLVNSNPIVRKTFEEAERYYTESKVSSPAAQKSFPTIGHCTHLADN